MLASANGYLGVVNRLLDWQQTQMREGFEISYSHGSLYVPVHLIELIVEFAG